MTYELIINFSAFALGYKKLQIERNMG